MLGQPVGFQVTMIPLCKGLEIGKIHAVVSELVQLSVGYKTFRHPRHVVQQEFELDHGAESINEEGQEGWRLCRSLQLPTSLVDCMQDVDVMGMKIEHRVKIIIPFVNPDGHASVVRHARPDCTCVH